MKKRGTITVRGEELVIILTPLKLNHLQKKELWTEIFRKDRCEALFLPH